MLAKLGIKVRVVSMFLKTIDLNSCKEKYPLVYTSRLYCHVLVVVVG